MKICFKWQGFVEKEDVINIVRTCEFLPVGKLQGQYTHDAKFNHAGERPKGWPSNPNKAYGWPENLAAEFCYTYIYGDYATRNVIDNTLPTWDIPDDEIADVVSLFCIVGADVNLSEELLTIKC